MRNPVANLPAEPVRRGAADDGALPVGQPRLHLVRRQLELRVHREVRLGLQRDLREEVRRILVDAAEPACCGWPPSTPGTAAKPSLVRDRQRLDQADLVDDDQPIEPRQLDAEAEGRPDRHQEAEQQERDEDAGQGEDRPHLAAPAGSSRPAAGTSCRDGLEQRCPCRGAMCDVARSAACGSCVTMTIVLPWSRLRVWSRSRISSPALRSRSPVGSSQSSSVGSVTIARAMPTRCSWPPDSCRG